MGPTEADLDRWFTYHAPDDAQIEAYQTLRARGAALAHAILTCCPPSADRTAAIRKVREAIMTANAAIACEPKDDAES